MLTQWLNIQPLAGRVVSFLFAASITWWLNRRFTFGASHRRRTWLPYLMATGFGAAINIAVYELWILSAGTAPRQLLAGVAIGSICALFFNFAVSRRIFRGRWSGATGEVENR